ncbi:single-stranded DNA-binding protein [Loigolactobacillus coryniformis]|jgi:single-strand DNA-binding protein|uniref:Single-stranded DNA-binding protein n=2 Tax=Loigolactobacillus coryniformis subsp. coryniformis TaxID=115541 RepID=J2ZK91_9LACO|nr:single-stranded DNA-binding protein [Loigolactobacillus coryniformis]MDN6334689.1 single-stranded DNA-binding protein [Lacticaseibacillus paracasei]OEH90057.1 single-stranded DNA-binding protein [Loigolactobacillus coryniformis subsp. coryniformis]ATO54111.1 single-stranded DNA-binding protein [Loigolactobacillus coryniformis subsp. coryniformis KCTC 3167 = DSM 20001]EJN53201.1 Single-stranded DNA-binding protein [Loigolactobacillus coryniformis subsp. coryniformis CECT 5711]KRK18569.1 sing
MINRVVLIGRLTRDTELRYTSGGAAVASFTLAVNRQFTNRNGEREADFINCVMWRKSAENFTNFTHKGSLVGIEGRIQTRNYDNAEGQRVYVTEVVADNFSLLESRSADEHRQSTGGGQSSGGYNNNNQSNGFSSSNNAFNSAPQSTTNPAPSNGPASSANSNPNDPFANNGESIDISDDDLPF